MKKNKFDTLLKNNKIKAMPIFEYVNKQYAKLGYKIGITGSYNR